ncbi:T9SS type A sorting domain-containing protein [Chryseobacterium sp. RLHN22]|uniref:T9SS type A sorting domain-containing protein n=1 Tax=Chryseobacterium sp. RLHN22 TaxID=3437885 RepID=UPI003D9B6247
MLKLLISSTLLFYSICYSQLNPTKAYFRYDEAGNQIYRGDNVSGRYQVNHVDVRTDNKQLSNKITSNTISDTEFLRNIRIYPVPVKDILTIDWNDSVNDLISDISLYEQNTVHWVFQSKNISTLNKQVKINLSQKYMGVYILTFVLKDGRRISKNITKM